MSFKKYVAAVVVLYSGASLAESSCVQEMKYPTKLRIPSLESWASGSGGIPSVERECELARQLSAQFIATQSVLAKDTNGNQPMRGTHSKGTCLKGTFQTKLGSSLNDAERDALLQTGIFGSSGQLATRFRFANGASFKQSDSEPDVRALSLKVDLPSGAVQDFSFNNVPRFQIDSLENFVHVMELKGAMRTGEIPADPVTHEPKSKPAIVWFFAKKYPASFWTFLKPLENIQALAKADQQSHASYTNQNYWSTTAFAVGSGETVAKFGAMPGCESMTGGQSSLPRYSSDLGSKTISLDKANEMALKGVDKDNKVVYGKDSYLKDALIAQVKTAPVCYSLFAQFLDEETSYVARSTDLDREARGRELVENPTIVWNGPIHVVGQIRVVEPVGDSECDDHRNAINVMAASSGNNLGIQGIGQINRGRQFVEAASLGHR